MSGGVHEIVMGLIGLSVTLLGALIVMVWRFSALATTLGLMVRELKEDLAQVRSELAALKNIPVLEQRVAQLEDVVRRLTSWWPSASSKLDVLYEKVFSLQGFRARMESVHDVDEEKKA